MGNFCCGKNGNKMTLDDEPMPIKRNGQLEEKKIDVDEE